MHATVILNPAAGGGRAFRLWPSIRSLLDGHGFEYELLQTRDAGDERTRALQALDRGAEHVIAVGGDGTVNGVLNALGRDSGARRLSTVPAGTGNELARFLGYRGPRAAVEAIVERRVRRLDLLVADCVGADGKDVRHVACAAVSWGAAAEISYRANRSRFLKALGGRLSYFLVTLGVTLSYDKLIADLRIDARRLDALLHYTGLICNFENFGGGMKLAPGADPDDGVADLVLFRDIARRDILLQPPGWLFEGRHVAHEEVELIPGKRFVVRGPADVRVDADGETIGRLPLEVTVRPKAITICG